MIFNIGYLLLVAAMVLAAFGIFAGLWGGFKRQSNFAAASFHAVYAVAGLVALAAIILWYGLIGNHFELAYVWNHSERALPVFYKFAALWGGQAGSLLFWVFVLGVFSTTAVVTYRNKMATLMPFVNAMLLMTSLFFLVLLVFSANPFEQYGFAPPDGQGLNPLLQNYWMVIHPIMLYFGYVGLAVPFAFGAAALLSKQVGNEWVRVMRRWTLIPWMFLSAGIIMGSQWAYMELGWGGYWAWDPVENASFLPWITATAFLHSLIIQDRRGMLKVWNMVLIWATYFLVILGTFTTRSGILESVHSFARSNIGPFFLGYLIIVAFGFLWLLFLRMPLLQSENQIDSAMSREAAFLANNWLFTGIAFATLWGTFFPMFSEIVTSQRISVAAPWFNKVVGPLFLLLFLMMGIGPLLGWRRTSKAMLIKQFTWPVVISVVFAVALFVLGHSSVYSVIGLALCVFVTVTIVQEFVRGVLARRTTTGENPFTAMWRLMRRNGQRYGGYIVHLGIVLIGVAVIGNEFYQTTTNVTLGYGESAQLGRYTFVFDDLVPERASNRDEYVAYLTVANSETGNTVGELKPKRNIYFKTPDMPTSEVGLIMRPTEDIYVVLNGWDQTTATFSIFLNPLTMWMWVGGLIIVLGTLICVWPVPRRREVTVTMPHPTIGAAAD
ncbi:MAG: heme lyase CcmF/NrfE family subunit [Caldilineaceae bacterium]|nr:heme lyase CcmF/NrfE family subunit [Caldilineaceae bacterium]